MSDEAWPARSGFLDQVGEADKTVGRQLEESKFVAGIAGQAQPGLRKAAILHRQRGAEPGAGLQRSCGEVIEAEAARHPDAAEFLRQALQPAAHHRKILV